MQPRAWLGHLSGLCARHKYVRAKAEDIRGRGLSPWAATRVRAGDQGPLVTRSCGTTLSTCTEEERHSTLCNDRLSRWDSSSS
jgi:hypothetical protein